MTIDVLQPGGMLGGNYPSVEDILKTGSEITRGFHTGIQMIQRINKDESGSVTLGMSAGGRPEPIVELRQRLLKNKVNPRPERVFTRGTFFPGMLLCAGWWERNVRARVKTAGWQDSVQQWLYRGFEEWAPSLDVSFKLPDRQEPFLYAQLGSGDEADSILVIVPWEKAQEVRDFLARRLDNGSGLAIEADIAGTLYHRKHLPLPEAEKRKIGQWGKGYDYCIYLDPKDGNHRIDHDRDFVEPYSGYLWQCLVARNTWEKSQAEGRMPRVTEVYFVWEHTDFTQSATVRYNLDSLVHKVDYIGKQLLKDDLVLLQKSSAMVPGENKLKTQEFYDYIVHGSDIVEA